MPKWGIAKTTIVGLSALALLSACATSEPANDGGELSFEDLLSGGKVADVDQRIVDAQKHPLGSFENPVRADMPQGQREYLSRLRCSDGAAPTFKRIGNFGPGIYGSIVDGYDVRCEGAEPAATTIVMDMYFLGYRETAAVQGFSIVD